jgi:quercetin dioxygenase-like cupin family protein
MPSKYRVVLSVIFALLSCTVYSAEVVDAINAGWKGEKRCENLYEDAQIRILRCTFPPNVGHERHSHPAFFNYILSGGHGQVTDSSGTREFESKTDQYRAGKAVEWHEMLNTGDSTLRYLIVEKKYEPEK